jgi:hypothetical protein
LNTVPSTATEYTYPSATDYGPNVYFKVRYVNGTTVGPFSNEYLINVQA